MIIRYDEEEGYQAVVGCELWYFSEGHNKWILGGTMVEYYFRVMEQSREITALEDAYYGLIESLIDRIPYKREGRVLIRANEGGRP